MAHELAFKADGAAAMAFVGETPWHGLGQRLTEGAPLETWAREAGFNWQAKAAKPTFSRDDGTIGTLEGSQVIYRSDTGAALSCMGDNYKIVQPLEVLEFFRDLIAGHGFNLHTAGVLQGGRKLWALAKNGHAGEVVKGDKVRQFLMLSTSLDGSSKTTAAFTAVRIVCANTLREATRTLGTDGVVKVSHRTEFDAAGVRAQLGYADETWRGFMEQAQTLAGKNCGMEEARELLRQIFGAPVNAKRDASEMASARLTAEAMARMTNPANVHAATVAHMIASGAMREQRSVARCLELFAGAGRGASHDGVAGTRWGLLNAVTEHIDHEQGRTADTRLTSAWFGRGDGFKQSTLELLTA